MLLDTTAPAAPTVTLGSGINNATNNGATSAEAIASSGVISVGGESGAKVEARFSRDASHTVIKTITLTSTSSQAVVLTSSDVSTLGDGTITVSVTQTDAAGNAQTATAATTTFVLDTTAPAAPTVTLGSGINNATSDGATRAEATSTNGVVTVAGDATSTAVVQFKDAAARQCVQNPNLKRNGQCSESGARQHGYWCGSNTVA